MAYKYTSETNVYNRTGLTTSEVNLTTNTNIINDAEAELEQLTGRQFTSGNTKTEYLNGPQLDILGYSGTKAVTVTVSEYPIQSISEFKILNIDGTTNLTYDTLTNVEIAAGTFESADYWCQIQEDPITHLVIPYGTIRLKSSEFPVGTQNIKVTYTYGYTTVPTPVQDLATCLAGIRMWVAFMGGQYNRLNSYTVPQQTVDKGDFYVRGNAMIAQLTEEANRLLDRIGRRARRLFFSSSGSR